MRYTLATRRPTGTQLAELEKFYLDHGKDPLFIPSLRENKEIKTIAARFSHIISQLNREHCHTLVPHGVGVNNQIYLKDDAFEEKPEIKPVPTIWTVTIRNFIQTECSPWVSSFSTEEAARNFQIACESKICELHMENMLDVIIDSTPLNDTSYLSMIEETYGDDEQPTE